MNNVVLVGYRGTGKSTVARLLGEALGRRVVSTDAEVTVRAGQSIASLVKERGWEAFREIESEVVRAITAVDAQVIDTGGGAILDETNRRRLRECGVVFWLEASVSRIAERIHDDADRPPLTSDSSSSDEIDRVLGERAPLYGEVAHHRVRSESETPRQVADSILEILRDPHR